MKKYSVYSLYVVRIEDCGEVYYFICKYDKLTDTYIEVFTNEKIKASKNNIEPLYRYYSILGQCNYTTFEPLMLDKSELLKKYIDINNSYREMQIKRMI